MSGSLYSLSLLFEAKGLRGSPSSFTLLLIWTDLVSWGSNDASTGRVSPGRNGRGSDCHRRQARGRDGKESWTGGGGGGRRGGRGGSGGR